MNTVRVEENGKVLRLYPSRLAAEGGAVILAKGALQRFEPVIHPSMTGWLIRDNETQREFDADGLVTVERGTMSNVPRQDKLRPGDRPS